MLGGTGLGAQVSMRYPPYWEWASWAAWGTQNGKGAALSHEGDCRQVWEQPLTCIKASPEPRTLIPILEMRKWRCREVQSLGHTAQK